MGKIKVYFWERVFNTVEGIIIVDVVGFSVNFTRFEPCCSKGKGKIRILCRFILLNWNLANTNNGKLYLVPKLCFVFCPFCFSNKRDLYDLFQHFSCRDTFLLQWLPLLFACLFVFGFVFVSWWVLGVNLKTLSAYKI